MGSEVADEARRLAEAGLWALGYRQAELERCARLTLAINREKARRSAVIPAHVYQRSEILHGVADFTGDSYRLAKLCVDTKAERIVFCGVRFMAETAKILNPGREVYLPAGEAGCSLAEAITAGDVRRLKAAHPGAPVVSYINTTAGVKAESDVIVTSANAPGILRKLFESHQKLIFVPDEWMGRNLARELGKEPGRDLILWKGSCVVHENFDPASIPAYRAMYPGLKILAHAECSPSLVRSVDFVGGTGDMLRFVEATTARNYMLVTECGLGELARTRFPRKSFIPMCRLCPYMKAITLEKVLEVLELLPADRRIELDPGVMDRARRAIDRMFQLS